MTTEQTTVDVLDRRFKSLDERTGQDYLLHFVSFTQFLWSDPQVAPYTQQAVYEFSDALADFDRDMADELMPLRELRNRLVKVYPEADDSDAEPPEDILDRHTYRRTLAYADDLIKGVNRLSGESFSSNPSAYDDETRSGLVLSILHSKISGKLDEDDEKEKARRSAGKPARPVTRKLDKLWASVTTLGDKHRYRFRGFINYRRTSPGQALVNMRDLAGRLNREPVQYTSVHEQHKVRSIVDVMGFGYLDEILYRSDPDARQLEQIVRSLREYTRVAYEGIRETVGRLGARMQVAHRFATRCTRYDSDRVRQIGCEGGEVELTRYLALYLYDQGLPVVTRMRLGAHEMDIADPVAGRILVEAKVCRPTDSPAVVYAHLVQGVAQVHSYLNNFAAAWGTREAYLAIFRLGGPLADLPEVIRTPRFSIYPVIIDVGEAIDSGSKQPKPVMISEDNVFAVIEAEQENGNA